MNFIIKTHTKDTQYNKPCLFLLNKGLNSGKPQKEPFTNSFVIIFENQDDVDNVFFISYSLWKTKFWHQFLIGSVIPFLRLQEFKKEFNQKVNALMQEHEKHKKSVAALKLLEEKENQFLKNLNLISDLRKAIIYQYIK
ncbi:DUF6943 family protein [Flavobacterium sp.]|jgi:hypothetical protein|uniref:DUF6943 family protein n=1 Tax=Flavobacterium sp. TaxID=239 RepID=UPI0037BE621F